LISTPIYLDNLATTRVDPRVLEGMLPFFSENYGNPASRTHSFGWKANEAVEQARAQVAALLGGSAREVVFTSGATESNNLAIKGVAEAYRQQGNRIVTCCTEHKAVLDCCRELEDQGFEVVYLPVDAAGMIDLGQLEAALDERTILVSLMAANNEIGTVQPLAEIGALVRDKGGLWHCDAAQAAGKIELDVAGLGIDLLSISAHKIYGPKGVGALWVGTRRPRTRLRALFSGGGQERGLRAGTLNVPGIVGLGLACSLCQGEMPGEARRLRALRQRLYSGIAGQLDDVRLNGHLQQRLPGNLNLSFGGLDGAGLLLALRDIALSSGSACTAGSNAPSHVLQAIGLDDALAFASLRFGLGRFNTAEEIDYAIERVVEEVTRLRGSYHGVARLGAEETLG
jgi:cysteine desulfurase